MFGKKIPLSKEARFRPVASRSWRDLPAAGVPDRGREEAAEKRARLRAMFA